MIDCAERLTAFEKASKLSSASASYEKPADESRGDDHPLHEVRWVYTALYMMAQRLATTVQTPVDRATRRRAVRNNQVAPDVVRVITLRRLAADRARDAGSRSVDWHWKWAVRGHWREQPYPSLGITKTIFIESYIKGPEHMPLKPDSVKVFVAKR